MILTSHYGHHAAANLLGLLPAGMAYEWEPEEVFMIVCNDIRKGFVSSFPFHGHSAFCNVYPVALDRTRR